MSLCADLFAPVAVGGVVEPLLFIDDPKVSVRPGNQVTAPIRVRNVGNLVEEFDFEALGLPSSFAKFDPQHVSLFPSEEGYADVVFAPQRTVPPVPGPFSFGVRAVSAVSGETSGVAEGVVEILPFGDLRASLRPESASFRRSTVHHVVLENYGNVEVRVSLHATDSQDRLHFDFAHDVVAVPPGAVVEVRLHVHARAKIRGAPSTHQMHLTVTYLETVPDAEGNTVGERPITLNARLVQRPVLPGWVIPVAIISLLILAVAAFFIIRDVRRGEQADVQTGPPPPPRAITAAPASTSSATISWKDTGGEDGYRVFSSTSSAAANSAAGTEPVRIVPAVVRPAGGNTGSGNSSCPNCMFLKDLPANTTSYTAKNLKQNTQYCFYVIATFKSAQSVFPKPACTATTPTLPPCTPVNLAVSPMSGSTPTLLVTWQAGSSTNGKDSCNENANPSYQIQQDFGSGNEIVAKPQAGDTATTIDNLSPLTQYCYRIQAVASGASSPFTSAVCATTGTSTSDTSSSTTTPST